MNIKRRVILVFVIFMVFLAFIYGIYLLSLSYHRPERVGVEISPNQILIGEYPPPKFIVMTNQTNIVLDSVKLEGIEPYDVSFFNGQIRFEFEGSAIYNLALLKAFHMSIPNQTMTVLTLTGLFTDGSMFYAYVDLTVREG